MRQPGERVQRIFPVFRQRARARQQPLTRVDVERGEPRRAGDRVRGIGVAVEQLDGVLGTRHEGVVDLAAHDHAAHRHHAVREPLGAGDDIRRDVELLCGERRSRAAEARDHLVEDQQDAVLRAQLAQPLQVAFRRQQHAGRARDRLDDHGRDRRGVVQPDQPLQLVGEFRAVLGQAARERVAPQVVRVLQVIDTRQGRAEELAVVDHAAHGDAAEADTVIAALAADEALARGFAAHAMPGQRDLERGVHGLGARIREEHVIEAGRRQLDDAVRELECGGMAELERRRVVECRELLRDGLDDLPPPVPGHHAPESRRAVEDLPAVVRPVVHALGAREQPRRGLELAIRRERHPEGFELLTRRSIGQGHAGTWLKDRGESRDDRKIDRAPQTRRACGSRPGLPGGATRSSASPVPRPLE